MNRRDWFTHGLGSKTRTLTSALKSLEAGKKGAADELRHQARLLLETGRHYGSTEVADKAFRAVNSSDEDLPSTTGNLLKALAHAQAEAPVTKPTVLVIGGDNGLAEELRDALGPHACGVAHVATPDEARKAVADAPVDIVITHVALQSNGSEPPGSRFADKYWAASPPILYISDRIGDEVKRQVALADEDGYLEGTPSAEDVAAWVMNRVRRAHNKARPIWHDRVTGLPGRESFMACYPRAAKFCASFGEPLCLALVRAGNTASPGALDRIGRLLSENLRSTDLVARWDDSTFAILFPGEDQFGAVCAVEKIRDLALDAHAPDEEHAGPAVAVSAGISLASSDRSIDDIVSEAEEHLERARETVEGGIAFSRKRLVSRKANVLIASADPLVARALCGILEADAFRATVSTDVHHALGCCGGHRRYQLIVIDENVEPSGLDVLKALKNLERNLCVPAVVLMAGDSAVRRADYRTMGASECFARPLNATEILERARCLVWAHSMFDDPVRRFCHLLLIADDPAVLYLAAASLNAHGGFLLSLAKGGRDGARRLSEDAYDGIIVPKALIAHGAPDTLTVCGYEIADGDVSVIAMIDRGTDLEPALAKACEGVLALPLDTSSLAASLEKMLELPENRSRDKCPPDFARREVQRIADMVQSKADPPLPARPVAAGEGPAGGQSRCGGKPQTGAELKARTTERRRADRAARGSGRARKQTANGARPLPPPSGKEAVVDLGGAVRMEFLPIGPGTATLGSPSAEEGREADEVQRTAVLAERFWIGKFPVTQEQWERVMGDNPSVFEGARNPVECVSWRDAQAFCEALTAAIGKAVRLPTEEEWEFACRGGTHGPYYAGERETHLDRAGWYDGNSGGATHAVGQKEPNRFGLFDMHGNVWEWCQDRFERARENEPTDARVPAADVLRVFRGGCWCSQPTLCRAAYRGCGNPLLGNYGMGLRVVTSQVPDA